LTRLPGRSELSVVNRYVSGITLKLKSWSAISVTVRSTPSTAMLSPSFVSSSTREPRTESRPSPAATTSPTSSMIPVNTRLA
jgi:hypothetical protein